MHYFLDLDTRLGVDQNCAPEERADLGALRVPVHPGSSGAEVSARMSRLRRRDNPREMQVRSALHRSGLRFRVTYPVPGMKRRSIDIAFTRARVAVFLDGCFWHGCPDHGTRPRANSTWWTTKLAVNQARDHDTDQHLNREGWQVVRIWEHEPFDTSVALIEAVVRAHQPDRQGRSVL